MRRLVYGVLPGLILVLAMIAGWVRWYDGSSRADELKRAETISVATESTTKMLSCSPDTIERDLAVAQQLMTDGFRKKFAERARENIIPDAKASRLSATAEVTGAASMWTAGARAAVLVFADRTVAVGSGEPDEIFSSYRVTLDRVDGRWLVADFEPV